MTTDFSNCGSCSYVVPCACEVDSRCTICSTKMYTCEFFYLQKKQQKGVNPIFLDLIQHRFAIS